jgi:hypothetical protein
LVSGRQDTIHRESSAKPPVAAKILAGSYGAQQDARDGSASGSIVGTKHDSLGNMSPPICPDSLRSPGDENPEGETVVVEVVEEKRASGVTTEGKRVQSSSASNSAPMPVSPRTGSIAQLTGKMPLDSLGTPSKGTMISSQSSSRNRYLSGLLLLAVSIPAFIWYSEFRAGFMPNKANDAFLCRTFLALAILFAGSGLMLLLGGRFASAIYRFLGLAQEPLRKLRPSASVLQILALWHISIGWFLSTAGMTGSGYELGRTIWFLVVFGLIPGMLAPFYLRGKRWALWAASIVFLLGFFVYTVSVLILYTGHNAVKPPIADIAVPIIYWILSGAIAFDSFRSLWISRSIVKRSAVAREPDAVQSTTMLPATPISMSKAAAISNRAVEEEPIIAQLVKSPAMHRSAPSVGAAAGRLEEEPNGAQLVASPLAARTGQTPKFPPNSAAQAIIVDSEMNPQWQVIRRLVEQRICELVGDDESILAVAMARKGSMVLVVTILVLLFPVVILLAGLFIIPGLIWILYRGVRDYNRIVAAGGSGALVVLLVLAYIGFTFVCGFSGLLAFSHWILPLLGTHHVFVVRTRRSVVVIRCQPLFMPIPSLSAPTVVPSGDVTIRLLPSGSPRPRMVLLGMPRYRELQVDWLFRNERDQLRDLQILTHGNDPGTIARTQAQEGAERI